MAQFVYLRMSVQDHHSAQFERDLHEALEIARGKPGFRWAQLVRDVEDPTTYIVLSEWRDRGGIEALEADPLYRRILEAEAPFLRGRPETLFYRSESKT